MVMKSNITTEIVVTLVLDQAEARWLNSYMQNKLLPDESSEDILMRQSFFDATKPATQTNQS